jgi:hypothetical protein
MTSLKNACFPFLIAAWALLPGLFFQVPAQAQTEHPTQIPDYKNLQRAYKKVLRPVQKGGPLGVDYAALKKGSKDLDAFLKEAGGLRFSKNWTAQDKLAFLVNTYNALAMKAVLALGKDGALPKSVREDAGFFDKRRHVVMGDALTLNELEKKAMDLSGHDPRMHFVLNCASKSCPTIGGPYTGGDWEKSLEASTWNFLRLPGEVEVNDAQKTITLNQIFEWYAKDFGGEKGVRAFVAKYGPASLAKKVKDPAYKVQHRQYDWALNGAAR